MNKNCLHWIYNTVGIQEEGSTVSRHHCIFLPHSSMCKTRHDRRHQTIQWRQFLFMKFTKLHV
jgi:hypothetical protein